MADRTRSASRALVLMNSSVTCLKSCTSEGQRCEHRRAESIQIHVVIMN